MRRVIVGVAVVALLAGACGDDGAGEPITHPSTPDAVILRLQTSGGGPPPPGFLDSLRRLPVLTIYGDGTVIRGHGEPDAALRTLEEATISEAGIQLVLQGADDAGLLDGDAFYDHPELFDFDSLSFTVTAGGATSRVGVYAPGEEGGEEPGRRRAVVEYRERFFGLAEWLGAELSPFTPRPLDRVLVVVVPSLDPPFTFGEPEYRPWAGPALDDQGTFTGTWGGEPCFVLSGDALAALLPDFETATEDTVWQAAGRDLQVVLRPLLSDEDGCT